MIKTESYKCVKGHKFDMLVDTRHKILKERKCIKSWCKEKAFKTIGGPSVIIKSKHKAC